MFLALPDSAAAELAPALVDAGVRVIDLSGAFRLRDDDVARPLVSGDAPRSPAGVAYGLTERERDARGRARGSSPTRAAIRRRRCWRSRRCDGRAPGPGADIIVDAKSGVSGAGKTPSERTHFSECHGSMSAYGVFNHRHGAEIEQGLGRPVTFTPHLVPIDRGILSTIYVRVAPGTTEEALADLFRAPIRRDVRPARGPSLPEIKHVAHTNFCDIGWRVDPSGRAILVSVIDNLLKGASGQAVQNMNVMLGLDEQAALL